MNIPFSELTHVSVAMDTAITALETAPETIHGRHALLFLRKVRLAAIREHAKGPPAEVPELRDASRFLKAAEALVISDEQGLEDAMRVRDTILGQIHDHSVDKGKALGAAVRRVDTAFAPIANDLIWAIAVIDRKRDLYGAPPEELQAQADGEVKVTHVALVDHPPDPACVMNLLDREQPR